MPSEAEFVATLEPAHVRQGAVLEATEEQLQRTGAAPRRRGRPPPAPSRRCPPSYPPLEPAGR
jgi:hypothetical protein